MAEAAHKQVTPLQVPLDALPCFSNAEIRELGEVLLAHARRAVSCPNVAEDLVQETAAAAVAAADSFRGQSTLRTWLIGILSHKIMDHYRGAHRRGAAPLDAERDLVANGPSPEHRAQDRQALDILEAALPELPELERLSVLLVDVEGLDREVACNAMDVRPTHLRVLLHRGRHRLRKALANAGVSPRA